MQENARMPGNPKDSKWRSTPQHMRKRKLSGFTLSKEAKARLVKLAARRSVSQSEMVEALIMAAPLANAEVIAKYGETFERLAEHDAAPEACEDPESCGQWWECRACGESFAFRQGLRVGRNEGAAVVAGVIALGTWAANGPLVVERSYWTSEIDGRHLYDCTCAGCGCALKGLEAGVHEGADREWCGVCRG